MKAQNKFLIAAAGVMLSAGLAAQTVYAQDTQTTTTRETTTTTEGMQGPPSQMEAPMPGYADFGYAPDNYAAHRGYNDGYNKGMSDHNTGHSYRPTSDHYYNHPIGYNGGALSHDEYNRIYREAFLHGYERGYRHANSH
jgi:hypothetical protein